jgi:hypothetical protein
VSRRTHPLRRRHHGKLGEKLASDRVAIQWTRVAWSLLRTEPTGVARGAGPSGGLAYSDFLNRSVFFENCVSRSRVRSS